LELARLRLYLIEPSRQLGFDAWKTVSETLSAIKSRNGVSPGTVSSRNGVRDTFEVCLLAETCSSKSPWIPAFAGMTSGGKDRFGEWLEMAETRKCKLGSRFRGNDEREQRQL